MLFVFVLVSISCGIELHIDFGMSEKTWHSAHLILLHRSYWQCISNQNGKAKWKLPNLLVLVSVLFKLLSAKVAYVSNCVTEGNMFVYDGCFFVFFEE